MTRATEAIGDCPPANREIPDPPAGRLLLTVTGTVGSLRYAACAISDRVIAGWIRASLEVVVVPVAVAPSSA